MTVARGPAVVCADRRGDLTLSVDLFAMPEIRSATIPPGGLDLAYIAPGMERVEMVGANAQDFQKTQAGLVVAVSAAASRDYGVAEKLGEDLVVEGRKT